MEAWARAELAGELLMGARLAVPDAFRGPDGVALFEPATPASPTAGTVPQVGGGMPACRTLPPPAPRAAIVPSAGRGRNA